MAQGRGSAAQGFALFLLAACLLLGAADVAGAATYNVDWSFAADSWSGGKNFRAGDVLGEWTKPSRQILLRRIISSVARLIYSCFGLELQFVLLL